MKHHAHGPSGVPVQTRVRPDSTTRSCFASISPRRPEIWDLKEVSLLLSCPLAVSTLGLLWASPPKLYHHFSIIGNKPMGRMAPEFQLE